VERIWGYLRSHYLGNRVYKNYHHLFEALTQAWDQLDEKHLASLTHDPWVERAA
jgi:hypothetical protein